MDSESIFWTRVWGIVGLCFCVLVMSVASCTAYNTTLIVKSPDPLSSACAVNGGRDLNSACIALKDRVK